MRSNALIVLFTSVQQHITAFQNYFSIGKSDQFPSLLLTPVPIKLHNVRKNMIGFFLFLSYFAFHEDLKNTES